MEKDFNPKRFLRSLGFIETGKCGTDINFFHPRVGYLVKLDPLHEDDNGKPHYYFKTMYKIVDGKYVKHFVCQNGGSSVSIENVKNHFIEIGVAKNDEDFETLKQEGLGFQQFIKDNFEEKNGFYYRKDTWLIYDYHDMLEIYKGEKNFNSGAILYHGAIKINDYLSKL